MFKNTASQKVVVFAFDATTNLPKTGDAANITAYISKDFGAVTVLTDTSATEMDATNAKGYYLFDISQTETNADFILVSAKSSTSNIVVIGAPGPITTLPPNFGATSIDSNGRLDIIKVAGTAQTAGDIPARLPAALVGGRMDSSVGAMAANTLTAAATAADFGAEVATAIWGDNVAGDFTVAASVGKSVMNGVALGTGLTIAAVSGAVGSVTGAVGSVTGAVGSVTGAVGSVTGAVGSVTGAVGSVAAGGITAASFGASAVNAAALATDAANEIADALLDRDMSTGTDSGSPSVRTVRQALRASRNKVSIAAGTVTITKEDDTTASWTGAVTTTAGNPISAVDPA